MRLKNVFIAIIVSLSVLSVVAIAEDTAVATTAAKPEPALVFAQTEMDLGEIASDEDIISAEIVFANTSSAEVKIEKVQGTCSCFMGWDGDKSVKPGESGKISVMFDRKKIEAGKVMREVHIYTDDPAKAETLIQLSFNILRSPVEEELWQLRQEVIGLRQEIKTMRNELKTGTGPAAAPAQPVVDTTVYEIPVGSSPVKGPAEAPVTIVEFTDFQCPYCTREYPTLQQVLKEYPDKVKLVYKHYPLSFHKLAKPAHVAAELAKLSGGNDAFWQMHDMILANPEKLETATLRSYAEKLSLDLKTFDDSIADEAKMNELLLADKAIAEKCNVRGTPSIFINGLRLSDRSIEAYRKRIDEILAR